MDVKEAAINIQELAAWGELLGGLAVIGGLIFVGVQIRMANRESRIAANESYVQQIGSLGLILASNPDFADIFRRGSENLDSLNPTERLRYISFCSNGMFRLFENLHIQHQTGRLEDRVWIGVERTLKATATSPGIQAAWRLRRNWFEEDFQGYFDQICEAEAAGEIMAAWSSPE
ncbi:MAG: hypothetical protein V2I63_04435 [Pseudomonadales bacterium]|nr:hypothetical protein [Pseudomonadales bacterium]